jgi:hypothetical protein
MGTEGTFLFLQEHATCPYSMPSTPFLLKTILILPPIYT